MSLTSQCKKEHNTFDRIHLGNNSPSSFDCERSGLKQVIKIKPKPMRSKFRSKDSEELKEMNIKNHFDDHSFYDNFLLSLQNANLFESNLKDESKDKQAFIKGGKSVKNEFKGINLLTLESIKNKNSPNQVEIDKSKEKKVVPPESFTQKMEEAVQSFHIQERERVKTKSPPEEKVMKSMKRYLSMSPGKKRKPNSSQNNNNNAPLPCNNKTTSNKSLGEIAFPKLPPKKAKRRWCCIPVKAR